MSLRISKSGLAAAIIATLSMSDAAIAAEQTAEAATEARAAVKEGARLFEQKDYEAALVKFQAAYAALPSPKLHYNFGLTYLALGRKPDALEAFEAFLRNTEVPPPVQKLKAAQQIEDLRKDVMLLSLACNIDGAKVVIDGRLRGFTPLGRSIPLDAGAHELLMERDGTHQAVRQMLLGSAGQIVALKVDMKEQEAPKPATLATAPVESPSQPLLMPAAPPPEPKSKPFYTSGWFWGAVGVAVVASTAVFFALRSTNSSTCPPDVLECVPN